jgi:hypothetical protein
MMQDIVTLDQAKKHLRLDGTSAFDVDLTAKIEEATVTVLDYVRQQCGDMTERATWYATVDAWDEDTAPLQVRAAILKLTGYLFGDRGDGEPIRKVDPNGDLPGDVTMFLTRLRDRAMA